MKICATIAARGGSKGVPGKNIRDLLGKPLIVHTIEQAHQCEMIERIIVTTDSSQIADVARKSGYAEVPFIRPAELAADTSGKLDALKHAIRFLMEKELYVPDYVVDLDPTSPLRSIYDIRGCINLMIQDPCDAVITGCRSRKSPYFNMVELDGEGRATLCKKLDNSVIRRQDAPAVYDMNASIYVYRTSSLLSMKTLWDGELRLYEMPEERSIDIDREIDFKLVELLMREKGLS